MSELERRYNKALDLYPSMWREANADAMLGTLLDEADAHGRRTPARGQMINLFVFALRERARAAVPSGVRDRAAALAWGFGAAMATVMFAVTEWAHWTAGESEGGSWVSGFGPFDGASALLFGLWIAGFALAVSGRGGVARWLIAGTIPVALALVAFDDLAWAAHRPTSPSLVLFVLLALLVAQGKPIAGTRQRSWLFVVAMGSVAFFLPLVFVDRGPNNFEYWWDTYRTWIVVSNPLYYVPVFLIVALVAAVVGRRHWAAAALMLSATGLPYVLALTVVSVGPVVPAAILVAVVVVVLIVRWTAVAATGGSRPAV